jgi:hypothetical protein
MSVRCAPGPPVELAQDRRHGQKVDLIARDDAVGADQRDLATHDLGGAYVPAAIGRDHVHHGPASMVAGGPRSIDRSSAATIPTDM